MLQRPPRDTRLDLVRGWLQLQIFASHAHGSLIGAWLISAAWGFSDSSEQFVYLSGFVVGAMAAMVIAIEMAVPLPGEARRLGWGWLLEAPWLALPGAAVLLWQPT